MTAPRSRRRPADERRAGFIEATLTCLAAHGYHGTTVRGIAAEAGVTPGLLRHYYASKDALVAEAYRTLAQRTLDDILSRKHERADRPGDRLSAFITASFAEPNLDPALLRIWINFWGLVHSDTAIRDIHAQSHRRYRETLEGLIADAVAAQGMTVDSRHVSILATGISALLDGLWVELCLDARPLDAGQAEVIARHFIERATGLTLP